MGIGRGKLGNEKNLKEIDRNYLHGLELLISRNVPRLRVRTQKEVKSMGKKTYIALENT